MIKIENLSYTYGDGTQAIKNLNISFPSEHIFAIMGFSGSGKTTLLNCISRFIKPQQGKIFLDNQNIFEMDVKSFREAIGVVFQALNLFPHMTVLENMTLAPCRLRRINEKDAKNSAREMLERLGILELADHYPSQVSGGQAQRVAIGRGLMLKPRLMLLDEPTSALDARTTEDFSHWIRELQSDTNFIVVTHDLEFARTAASKGMFMSEGEIVESGNIDGVLRHIKRG
ncbi:MAG: amino acid ABC transporter ATP-binding protein [Lentisphaerae bacterium]|nr:ATP-binding cassette domain-containing protein [Victivallaceae bacterium]NLK82580.1 amino acid ABC transporter ATP-binding protein [Lentisphaerota bacterium]